LARIVTGYAVTIVLAFFLIPCIGYSSQSDVADGQDDQSTRASIAAVQYAYRDYSQIRDALLGIQGQHSDISRVFDIGDSWEKTQGIADRDIIAIKISDNVAVEEDEPEVLIMALHHAREWSTSELALMIADNLTDSYGNDSRTSWLVDNREIWIVPVVNPDGLDYALAHDQWWRKNRHHNSDGSYGVDLNRNYNGSENGDSAGAWGGAGSSHVTTDEIYCGEYAFSEPETCAVRDLVKGHDFSVAIDLHSYGQWVMWPWGYTNATTVDDPDLQKIGKDFAALNGYHPAQSIALYPTTGDTIDWMYGSANIYAFCFEVGLEFHPMKSDNVWGIIHNNMAPAKLAIEVAGDREQRNFTIAHVPSVSRTYSPAGFELTADVTADRGVNSSSVLIRYRHDGQGWLEMPMSKLLGNDTYSAIVPSTTVGSTVEYYFVAKDAGDIQLMSPSYAPYHLYSFTVEPMDGGPIVSFDPPLIVEGSLATVVRANVTNVTGSFEPVFHMRNLSLDVDSGISMSVSGQNYSCEIAPGLPLGGYRTWLTIESNSSTMWSSDLHRLSVVDRVAPVIERHTVNQVLFGSVDVTVSCYDVYGVESVLVVYNLDGIPGVLSMDHQSGSFVNGTWHCTVDASDALLFEYRLVANDSRQESRSPSEGGWHHFNLSQEIPEMQPVAIVSSVIIIATAAVVARSRRR